MVGHVSEGAGYGLPNQFPHGMRGFEGLPPSHHNIAFKAAFISGIAFAQLC
jgi:hypothetical protein